MVQKLNVLCDSVRNIIRERLRLPFVALPIAIRKNVVTAYHVSTNVEDYDFFVNSDFVE
jgi:hypothetical protein